MSNTVYQEFPLEQVIINSEADIALIRIQGTVSYSLYVRPICLPIRELYPEFDKYWGSESSTEPWILRDSKLLAVGWGRLHLNCV